MHCVGLLLCLLLTITWVESQRTPTISYISPSKIYSKIGGTVELECSALYALEYPILWIKLPKNCKKSNVTSNDIRDQVDQDICTPIPLSSGSSLIVRDNRFSMRYDTASASYTLQIKDVQKNDEASYECRIIVSLNNKVTGQVSLIVSEPPEITDNSTRSVVVQENSPAELICYANGSPQPSISWRRQNNAILPTGGIQYKGNVLRIHSVKKEDRGTYYCVADNGIGKPVRRNVVVEVEFPPTVQIAHSELLSQALDYSVEMVCHIEAYPPPTITWVHDGIQLHNNQDFAVDSGFTSADDFTETAVRIKRLSRRQLGEYFCRAQNKLGSDEKKVTVQQSYEPNCVIGICEGLTSSSSKHHFGLLSIFVSIFFWLL